jgi:hypothetical protein
MPEPIPLAPRQDDTAADAGSLVRLGRADPPPVPASTAPAVDPGDDRDATTLKAALLDAGITTTAEDAAAVQALARLDTSTVQAVARWVKAKKPDVPKPTK